MLVIVSEKDIAGMNMREILMEKIKFEEVGKFDENPILLGKYLEYEIRLVTVKTDILYCDHVFEKFNDDIVIFLSRHSSKEGIPCLTTHCTGNFGKALYGGKDKKLSISLPILMKYVLKYMDEHSPKNFDVKMEVTHHGPTPNRKVCFIEVGSSEREWKNLEACEIAVNSFLFGLRNLKKKHKVAVGFGGPHYSPFTKFVLETDIAFGHILPKWAEKDIDEYVLRQMVEKNFPEPEIAYINWKGLRSEPRKKVVEFLEKIGLPFEKY